VPVANEKADLTIYRDAGTQVFELLDKQGAVCERTSIDEAYIDITRLAVELAASGETDPPTRVDEAGCHVLGVDGSDVPAWLAGYTRKSAAGDADAVDGSATAGAAPSVDTVLAAGAVVAARLRDLVRVQTGYTMSAGVAENKLLAKHASGMHKPYQQTVVRPAAVNDLMRAVKVPLGLHRCADNPAWPAPPAPPATLSLSWAGLCTHAHARTRLYRRSPSSTGSGGRRGKS
jgi:DNA polymerase eta